MREARPGFEPATWGCVGRRIAMELGIPFAEPPVGERRFLKPVAAAPWTGVFNATSQNKGCVQTDMPITPTVSFDMSETTEDCLYLNVWVPERACDNKAKDPCDKLLPVFVFLYGGFFGWGSTSLFVFDGIHFAARSKLIVITFNYRVNVFGFLNASSPVAPGNMGLYDQLEALRWIRDNVQAFGGDPDMVTIGGQSAGAISASYHMMSDLSKGLFKRAALLSGTPSTMAYSHFIDQLKNIQSISHIFNCTDATKTWESQITDAVSCLRKVEAHTLSKKLLEQFRFRYLTLLPSYGDEFLPNCPIDNDNVKLNIKEVFIGTTSDEGGLLMAMFKGQSRLGTQDIDAQTMTLLTLKFLFKMNFLQGNVFTTEYLTSEDNVTTLQQLSRMIGDAGFECPADIFASLAAERNLSVYRYLFDHRSSISFWDDWVGATHNDDLVYFLGNVRATVQALNNKQSRKILSVINTFPTEEEYDFSDDLIDALAEFCRAGKPKIPKTDQDWPKYTKEDKAYVILKPNDYSVAHGPRSKKCHLWEPYLVKRKQAPTSPAPKPKPTPKWIPEKRPSKPLRPIDNVIDSAATTLPVSQALGAVSLLLSFALSRSQFL